MKGRICWIIVLGLAAGVVALPSFVHAQEESPASGDSPITADAGQAVDAAETAAESDAPGTAELVPGALPVSTSVDASADHAASQGARDPITFYGLFALVPALFAIVLAIAVRQVVPALLAGVFVAAFMMVPCLPATDAFAGANGLVVGFRLTAERYIFGAIADTDNGFAHLKIIVFTLLIGFMVGIIGRNGGTSGMVKLVAGESRSRRRTGLTAWLAGLVVFFDDYANTMIVGPTMSPVFDRVKMSRAKLAYIVDSTAAPVASLALIGTWIGAEVGYIQSGLDSLSASGVPPFLAQADGTVVGGMRTFLSSIPYRFYPILALFLVFLVVLTGRDFGPMKRAERKVLSRVDADGPSAATGEADSEGPPARWWLGLVPVLVLVVATVWVLVATGLASPNTIEAMNRVGPDGANLWQASPLWQRAADVLSNADSYIAIFYGAFLSMIAAVLLTLVARACSVKDTFESGLEGMTRMFPAIVILVLAWALSAALQDLRLGEIVAAKLNGQNFPAEWLPLAVFLTAAVISFATGTSWGTMGILCPMTVEIAARLLVDVEHGEALNLFYASVGSVLAGAVFGDHCSPISDTTVLSSIACGCPHEEHVWTQIPYALVAAVAAMGLGDVLCNVFRQPPYLGIAAGAMFLVIVIFVVGRRAVPTFELADA